jgi:hypothetical protein
MCVCGRPELGPHWIHSHEGTGFLAPGRHMNELLFVLIALALVAGFLNFDHSGLLMSHETELRGT